MIAQLARSDKPIYDWKDDNANIEGIRISY